MSTPFKTTTDTHLTHTIRIDWFADPDMGPPWEEHDGHGIVSDWERRKKGSGERILSSDGGSHRFYDFKETLAKATTEQWGLSEEATDALARKLGHPPTDREVTVEAVEKDFRYLADWCADKWEWVGYKVTLEGPDDEQVPMPPHEGSLWGIDSPSMPEFEKEAIECAKAHLDTLATAAVKESDEAHLMACRDIVTA